MSANPKFYVFHLKELIYTAIFLILGILLILLLIYMFKPDDKSSADSKSTYNPGVYTTSLELNGSSFEVEVVVDSENINSVSMKNTDDSVSAMYPLMSMSIEDISKQIVDTQSLDSITYSESNKYTYSILLDTITKTLEKAAK
ncbi:MAG: hypothetical protein IJC76_00800 [Lachnospiraceae bacterium]|nr:hypothetical protein [Lachnospiraceae bacterium]